MTNHRCVLTFTHPTSPMAILCFPVSSPFTHALEMDGRTIGRTDRRTNLLASKLQLFNIYLHFQTQMREKRRHWCTNVLETNGRTDTSTYRCEDAFKNQTYGRTHTLIEMRAHIWTSSDTQHTMRLPGGRSLKRVTDGLTYGLTYLRTDGHTLL